MYKNDLKYNSLYFNGIRYNKGYKNGKQIFGIINVIPTDYILCYNLQNNLIDSGSLGLNGIPGGTSNSPSFGVGRKGNDFCANFNGGQSFKTPSNVIYTTDKISVSFWIKTTQTNIAQLIESSPDVNSNANIWASSINDSYNLNKLGLLSKNSNWNIRTSSVNINTGQWVHVVGIIDRSRTGADEIQIYINNELKTATTTSSADNNGIFSSQTLFIGQRNGTSYGFNGSMQQLRIYNRVLTTAEINSLYLE